MTSTLAPETRTRAELAAEVASTFITTLARRDFAGLASLCSPEAAVRALTPKGLASGTGPAFMEERFTTWFGGDDAFVVEESSYGVTGAKHRLSWRIAMTGPDGEIRKAEQQVFVKITDQIEVFDLVCTGWWSATPATCSI